jgi:hypothetical protein
MCFRLRPSGWLAMTAEAMSKALAIALAVPCLATAALGKETGH